LDGIDNAVEYARLGKTVNPKVDDVGLTRWEFYQLSNQQVGVEPCHVVQEWKGGEQSL
jgi:hypothetical protein